MQSDSYQPFGVVTLAKNYHQFRLLSAKRRIEENHLGGGTHTVMLGKDDAGNDAIICLVGKKMTPREMKARGVVPLPRSVEIDGEEIPVKVVQSPRPKATTTFLFPGDEFDQRLNTRDRMLTARDHQACFDAPLVGGIQIAPDGANWVGTLGGAVRLPDGRWGAITNAHVSGLNGKGRNMRQPDASHRGPHVGKIVRVVTIRFDGEPNYIDAAVIDCTDADGRVMVKPTQFDLGDIVPPENAQQAVGDRVTKSGRTTAITRGHCVGIEATSHVGYGEGTAKFERQLVVKGEDGPFSGPGDSGSLVLDAEGHPWGLLFAGGGGTTICNPIQFVLDWADLKFYQV